jgi:uncharacterized membrane protein
MSDDAIPQTLVGIAFGDTFRAQEFLTAVTRLAANERLVLKDAVIVHKDAGGHTTVRETTDPKPTQAALSGALWAGLFGLIIAGPVGWVAGAAVGAGAGAVTAKVVDIGISDEWVGWFREAVQPGATVLAVLAENVDREALVAELERFPPAHLMYTNLDQGWTDRMRDALGETAPEWGTPAEPPTPEGPETGAPASHEG